MCSSGLSLGVGGGLYCCLILIALDMFLSACSMHTRLGAESGKHVSLFTELRDLLSRFILQNLPPACRAPHSQFYWSEKQCLPKVLACWPVT